MASETASELKRIRMALNMNQEEFAKAIGRSYSALQQYEAGRKAPEKVLERARALRNLPIEVLRAKNIIQRAADILLEQALRGSDYAVEQLKRFGDQLQERAGHAVKSGDKKKGKA